MPQYLLAHDLGTSGNKATLYTTDGKLVGSRVYHYDTHVQNATWVEQDPEDWWRAVSVTTKELVADIDVSHIAAISFSGQMMGCLCVDSNGVPLRESLIWADMRATKEMGQIRERISERDFYHITGHRISPSYGGQKLMWVKDHEPEVYEKTYKILNAKDYIILKLTGRFVTEYTDASSTCLLDLAKLQWSDQLLEVMGLDRDKLPELCRSTDVAGTVTREAAAACGLIEGIPVVCGGGDGVCAAVGTGCVKEGIAHSCMGTSSWISITAKEPVYDDAMRTFTWAHIVPGYVLPTGTMQCGGGSMSWLKNTLCAYEGVLAQEQKVSVYDIIEQETNRSPVGARGLLFLPYLIGERSPRWNPNARGAFVGLTMEHTKDDIVRAVQEGVALNLGVVMDCFQKKGVKIDEMTLIGGGAKSAAWRQIFADMYRCRIQKPNVLEEATSMGAAITGGVGVGAFDDFDVIDRFLTIDSELSPIEENARIYDRLKPIFDECYEGLVGVYDKLAHL
ncbi:xylulokinase [Zongyangia hominis]|uniref:Xylulose kinase n=1 Tax=Zongyangia hominis TaxID=2763677 RepID=A0A926IB78_9FIRM|nr:xylulokinase [Zongyangia hominis]MBC8569897.1 xylulokinase [Zongyangia hominis]